LGNWHCWEASVFIHVMTEYGICLIGTGSRCEGCWHKHFSFSLRKLVALRMLFLCIDELWLIIHELDISWIVLWTWVIVIRDPWHHCGVRVDVWLDDTCWDFWWEWVICSWAGDILNFINYKHGI
jgi:hypothetical protein